VQSQWQLEIRSDPILSMATRFNPRPRGLTLVQQMFQMKSLRPEFRVALHRRQRSVTWVGKIRPTPMSDEYTVQIKLAIGLRPIVKILEPQLKVRDGASCLPHYYSDENSLCLHQAHEWNSFCGVADCIPWTSCWLYFYEVWFLTGSWEGGGTHPDKPEHRAI
jgi:hypothetical protein